MGNSPAPLAFSFATEAFTSPTFSESLWALVRYFFRYGYATLYCSVFRSRRYGPRGLRRLNALRPSALLEGFRSDLHTLLFRMGKRCSALPGAYSGPILPAHEISASSSCPVLNTRSLACIQDKRNFAELFPLATQFDWDLFREGWHRGYESRVRLGSEERGKRQAILASRHYAPEGVGRDC